MVTTRMLSASLAGVSFLMKFLKYAGMIGFVDFVFVAPANSLFVILMFESYSNPFDLSKVFVFEFSTSIPEPNLFREF